MAATTVVVPCYNEEKRLNTTEFVTYFREQQDTKVLFVDDGSTDQTAEVLMRVRAALPSKVRACDAVGNGGIVGYWDADLATPLPAIRQFQDIFSEFPSVEMVTGARVALLGREVKRKLSRHYLGRVFATLAANILQIPIYDTQCGAKLFRVTEDLRGVVLAAPFRSRWAFDVEMLARFCAAKRRAGGRAKKKRKGPGAPPPESLIYEYPLHRWVDVAGSKLGLRSMVGMGAELLGIGWTYFWKPGNRWDPQSAAAAGRGRGDAGSSGRADGAGAAGGSRRTQAQTPSPPPRGGGRDVGSGADGDAATGAGAKHGGAGGGGKKKGGGAGGVKQKKEQGAAEAGDGSTGAGR